jgi:DNA invertase Pin-like site-specific DNA recombinase
MSFTQVFAYIRFSSDTQTEGDSFSRQRASVQRFCSTHQIPLDSVRFIEDPAMSAFAGDHLKKGALGTFLQSVKSGQVKSGLFLVESVSRLSRQGAFVAFTLVSTLLDAGLHVAFIEDGIPPFSKQNTPVHVSVILSVLASTAQAESANKSMYTRANWAKRRKMSIENPGSFVFTTECPNWLEVIDGQYKVIEEKAASVLKIYELYASGWGIAKLSRYANENNLSAPGRSNSWHYSLVLRVLDNRAVIGEFQPHEKKNGKRTPSGPAIANFYPPVIPLSLWHKVRKLRDQSPSFPGKRDLNNFNFLIGLAKCSCGTAWRRMNKNSKTQSNYSLYGCANRQRAFTDCANINGAVFDTIFINQIYSKIPLFLKQTQHPDVEKLSGLQAKLTELREGRSRLLKLVERGSIADEDVDSRLSVIRLEETTIKQQIAKLDALQIPSDLRPYPELHLFLYAFTYFLDPEKFPEYESYAFKTRSYFRVRLLEIIDRIDIQADRTTLTIYFKNGQTLNHQLKTFILDPSKHLAKPGVPESVFECVKAIEKYI